MHAPAFADRQVSVTERADPGAFPLLELRRSLGIGPRGYRGNPAYSTLVDPGATDDPSPADLPDAAAQWRQWLIGSQAALVGTGGVPPLRIVERFRAVLGWPGPSPLARGLYNRTGLVNAVRVGGDPSVAADAAAMDEIRWLGTVDPALVVRLFGAPDPTVQEWLDAAPSTERTQAADRLQDSVDSLGAAAVDLVLGSIAADVDQYATSRTCAIAAQNSPIWPASLRNLLGGSTFWLVPRENGTVQLLGLLSMPALDEAPSSSRPGRT